MHLGLRLFAVIGAVLILERIWSTLAVLGLQPEHAHAVSTSGSAALAASVKYKGRIKLPVKASTEPERHPPALAPPLLAPPHATPAQISVRPPSPPRRTTIVAAALKHDNITWIKEFFPEWQHSIYVMDDPTADLTVARNKGNEGSAYLTYLITHYFSLPDRIVFIHGPRYQWHNEEMMYDHVPVLKNLRLSHIDDVGYASLRCTWNPGCPVSLKPDASKDDGLFGYEAAYAQAWTLLWPGRPMPVEVGAPCCAQFAVSKAQVWQRPLQDYERIRQWLWETPMEGTKSGRIMEYMWHVLFGQEPVACPDAKRCFCQKFGLCNIECSSEGACKDRFWQPWPMALLPNNWPVEGQGKEGWPVDGWWRKQSSGKQASPPASAVPRAADEA